MRTCIVVLLPVLALTACGVAVTPTVSPAASPTPRPTVASRQPTPTPGFEPTVDYEFHGPRAAVTDDLIRFGRECTAEYLLEDGTPAVSCQMPGIGEGQEEYVVTGPTEDLIGITLISQNSGAIARFVVDFVGSPGAEWVLDEMRALDETGVGRANVKVFGPITMEFLAIDSPSRVITIRATE